MKYKEQKNESNEKARTKRADGKDIEDDCRNRQINDY